MENLIVIPKPELSAFEPFVAQVKQSAKLMSFVGTVTEDKLPAASQMLTDAKKLIKTVEAELEVVNRPYINFKNEINEQQRVAKNRCSEVTKPLEDAIVVLSNAIIAYNRLAQEARRVAAAELQAKLKEQSGGVYRPENNMSGVSIAIPEAPKVKGLRKTIKYEVIDASQVPHGFCSPNDSLIQAAFKAGIRTIPGLIIWEEESISG